MGKPRKPAELKKLEGTYRADRERKAVKTTKLSEIVAPDWLSENQRMQFDYFSKILIRINLLEELDINTLIAYSIESARYLECNEVIRQQGIKFINTAGNEQIRVEVNIARQALDRMILLGSKLGLSPVDRQKLIEKKAEGPDDPLAGIL